jgi:hypothetical protein
MLRAIAVSALVSSLTGAAFAQDAPVVSVFVSGDQQSGPFLTYFIEDCGECFVAQFSCGDGGGFALLLPDFDDQTLSRGLADNGARGKLRLGATELELTARQITFSEMSGFWDVEFVAWGSDASALEPLALSEPAVVATAKGETALPAREADSANARAFIDACRARQ